MIEKELGEKLLGMSIKRQEFCDKEKFESDEEKIAFKMGFIMACVEAINIWQEYLKNALAISKFENAKQG